MAWAYEVGAVRWRRYTGILDVRLYRPAKGWSAYLLQLDCHPITGKMFKTAPQWWIKETYTGED